MALLDFLKKKEEVKKSQKADKKPEKVSVAQKQEKKADLPAQARKKPAKTVVQGAVGGAKVFSYDAVKTPHISEKASFLGEKNQYTFKVAKAANKIEVKKAVEGMYKVNVLSVNIVKIPGKKRRLGMIQGMRKGYKKAIVTIKEGQKIEIV